MKKSKELFKIIDYPRKERNIFILCDSIHEPPNAILIKKKIGPKMKLNSLYLHENVDKTQIVKCLSPTQMPFITNLGGSQSMDVISRLFISCDIAAHNGDITELAITQRQAYKYMDFVNLSLQKKSLQRDPKYTPKKSIDREK